VEVAATADTPDGDEAEDLGSWTNSGLSYRQGNKNESRTWK